MDRKWKKLEKGIYAVGEMKIIYFRIMVNGKRETKRSPLQGAAAIGANGKPTNELKKLALNWRYQLMNRDHYDREERKAKVPTFEKLVELYRSAADAERLKSGRPELRTIETAVKYFGYLVEGSGFKWTEPISRMQTRDIDRFIVDQIRRGKTPTTAWTYACSAQAVIPRWALEYYSQEGYDVRPYRMPVFRNRKPARYARPGKETLDAIRDWYEGLWKEAEKTTEENDPHKMRYRTWFFATMMLQFAMRNNDTARMTPKNFEEHDGTTYLRYTPHKTANSSGATVNWPMHPKVVERIRTVTEQLGLGEDFPYIRSSKEMSNRVNRQLRQLPGMADQEKGSYELRKLCIDAVYHKFGVEMAAAISGDDIKTLTYYYADTSRADVLPVMVEKLL